MNSIEGQTFIVTGAAVGLGRAYAVRLATHRAQLVLCDTDDSVEVLAGELSVQHGVSVESVVGSVANPDVAERAADLAIKMGGAVHGVVNNAGIGLQKCFTDCTHEDFQRLLDVHFFGTVNFCKAVWPHMASAGYGRIVNVVSSTMYGFDGWSAYGAAKGAIFGLSRTMALEGQPLGIFVNMIAPGAATPMMRANMPNEEIAAMMEATMPPEKVAPTVAFLLSSDCTFSGRAFTSSAGHIAALQLGVTSGVITTGSNESEVVRAINDPAMANGFFEETSVLASLARREHETG